MSVRSFLSSRSIPRPTLLLNVDRRTRALTQSCVKAIDLGDQSPDLQTLLLLNNLEVILGRVDLGSTKDYRDVVQALPKLKSCTFRYRKVVSLTEIPALLKYFIKEYCFQFGGRNLLEINYAFLFNYTSPERIVAVFDHGLFTFKINQNLNDPDIDPDIEAEYYTVMETVPLLLIKYYSLTG